MQEAEGAGLGPRVVRELLPGALKPRSGSGASRVQPEGTGFSKRPLCCSPWSFVYVCFESGPNHSPSLTLAPASFSGPPGTHQK